MKKDSFISFISLFYFSLDDPNVSLKEQKKSTFPSIRESLIRKKFYFGRFAKVYAGEMRKFREFFGLLKFLLAKVSAAKVFIHSLSSIQQALPFPSIYQVTLRIASWKKEYNIRISEILVILFHGHLLVN